MEEMISDYEERVAKEKQEPTNMYEDILLMNNGSRWVRKMSCVRKRKWSGIWKKKANFGRIGLP